jgi:hypothetical protein
MSAVTCDLEKIGVVFELFFVICDVTYCLLRVWKGVLGLILFPL